MSIPEVEAAGVVRPGPGNWHSRTHGLVKLS